MASRQRYITTGVLLGLYFGFFFRPVREPSLLMVVALSLLGAAVTVLIARRRGQMERPLLQAFLLRWAQFGLILAVFEGRHLAYDSAGRWGTVAFTTVMGGLIGFWYAMTNVKQSR